MESTIRGEITRVGYQSEWSEEFYATLTEVNGKSVDINAVIEIDGGSELKRGSRFVMQGVPVELTKDENHLISDGNSIKIICEAPDTIKLTGEAEHKIIFWFDDLNDDLQRKIYHFVDEESGAFIGALALGNRDQLSDSVIRDFRRCGISHVIALSGLHMAIIIGIFDYFLRKMSIKRSIRSVILSLIAFSYLALTGFSVSACRSVIMIFMVYIGHLIWRESDPITSLSLATIIILLISPYALSDVSLWMSVLATLGIIVVSDIVSPLGYKIKKKPLRIQLAYKLISSVSITLAAIFFVSVFNWLCFGEISIVSPLTNLIITPIVTGILMLGVVLILCLSIYPLAKLFGTVVGFLCNIVLELTEYVSNMRGITVSLQYDFVKFIAIPFIISLVIFLLVRIKRKWTITIIPTVAVVAFVLLFNIRLINNQGITHVTYVQSDSSEMIVITNNDGATVCDISTGGYRHLALACRAAGEKGATEIENVIITHYHNYHAPSLLRISEKYTVRNILLPKPETDEEIDIFNNITTALADKNVSVITYRRGYAIGIGEECAVNISELHYLERSKHPMLMIAVKLFEDSDSNELLYFSSPIFEDPYVDYPSDPDFIIVGDHGPRIYESPNTDLIERSKPSTLILSDGERMLFDDSTIKRLESLRDNFGTKILFDVESYDFILK
jgi:ComEC/Rec2-related protein